MASTSYIVLIREKFTHWNGIIFNRLKQRFHELYDHDIAMNLLERIRFVSMDYYLDVLIQARLVLDTFPYGGMIYNVLLRSIDMYKY